MSPFPVLFQPPEPVTLSPVMSRLDRANGTGGPLGRWAWRPVLHQPAERLTHRGAASGGPGGPNHDKGKRQSFRLSVLLAVPLALLSTGCHLVDQLDFRPKAVVSAVPPPPPVKEPETRIALVTIDYVKDNPDYRAGLAAAIKVVEQRRPGALYDIVAVVSTAAEAPAARVRAADVMTVVEAEGVIPARIQLGLRLTPGQTPPQIRIYLR